MAIKTKALLLILVVCLVFSLIPFHSVKGTSTKYEYYNTGDSGSEGVWGVHWKAQIFTVGATGHTVTSVKLKMFRIGSPGTLTVSIRATTDGKPSGNNLTSGTINGNTFTDSSQGLWYEITLTEYTLSANTQYAIVVRALTGDVNNYVAWRDDGGYANGDYCYSDDSGGSWTSSAFHDFMFEVWGNPAGVALTQTFYGTTTDGYIVNQTNNNYGACRNATTGTVDSSGSTMDIGQRRDYSAPNYFFYIYRGFPTWDTSTLSGTTLVNATLNIYVTSKYNTTAFNVTVQNGQPDYPSNPLVTSDFWWDHYSGDGGSMPIGTGAITGWLSINMTASGLTWISTTGTTKLALRSSRDINYQAVTDTEYCTIYSANAGVSFAPRLVVTYTITANVYTFHGPYREDGSASTDNATVTAYQTEGSDQTFNLPNGTVANTYTLLMNGSLNYFIYNITNISYNYSRIYKVTTELDFYIFLPAVTDIINLYGFRIIDFAGIEQGSSYFYTTIRVNNTNFIVEKQVASVINEMPFWLIWGHRYDIVLSCGFGTHSWTDFAALSTYSQTYPITRDLFPVTLPSNPLNVTAARINSTWIQVVYDDNLTNTQWVYLLVQVKNGSIYSTMYTNNYTYGQPVQFDWYNAISSDSYRVTLTASRSGTQTTYTYGLPAPPTTTNPWTGLLEGLGTWPIAPSQLFGFMIVFACMGAFSYASLSVGVTTTWILAMFLCGIGWLQIPWQLLAVSGLLVIFVDVKEAKKTEREI